MRENKTLEYKETVTNTFLKTVSAFANFGTGKILFGVRDDGSTVGVDNPEKVCLDIENRINDSIDPVPQYTLSVDERTRVITLTVQEGLYKPYFYKSKAYRRNDSATIEVDRLELTRLILEGQSSSFEELGTRTGNLHFTVLEEKLKNALHLEALTKDTLRTLELFTEKAGYNIAAELLADRNGFCGIDAVRFGDSIDILLDRETIANQSVLLQFDEAVRMYRKYYQYEKITGTTRQTVSLIPEKSFREGIANALVHRNWDVNTHINVAMFPDRIEITSPGGLPRGMSAEEYRRGGISILRNRILGNIFFRLGLIERFGTGIRRIHEAYAESEKKPLFEVSENSIRMVLPVFSAADELTEDENKIYNMVKGRSVSSGTIVSASGFGKTKVVSILKKLADEGYIRVTGTGRGTKYSADSN